jgi:AcrR family transcriptional regulator
VPEPKRYEPGRQHGKAHGAGTQPPRAPRRGEAIRTAVPGPELAEDGATSSTRRIGRTSGATPREPARAPWLGRRPSGRTDARTRLVEAAAACLLEEGWDRTSLSAVAARAGVTRPTVYAYFAGRDELLREGLALASSELVRQVVGEAASADSAAEFVVGATTAAVRVLKAHRDLFVAASLGYSSHPDNAGEGTRSRGIRADEAEGPGAGTNERGGKGAHRGDEGYEEEQEAAAGGPRAGRATRSSVAAGRGTDRTDRTRRAGWVPPMLGPEAISLAVAFLEPLKRFVPSLAEDPDELEEVAETALRFLSSVLEMETPRVQDEARLASYLRRRLVPALGLGPGPPTVPDSGVPTVASK